MQEWHSTRDTGFRDKARTMLHRELRKDRRSGGGISRNWTAKLQYQDLRQQLQSKREFTTKIYRKTIRLEIAK
jgi:hypothetical protein